MSPAIETLWKAIGNAGHGIALQCGVASVPYADLQALIERRILQLDALGAARVALALDNGIDWVLWDLALLFSGRVCVPLPAFFSPDQQAHVLDSAGIDTVIGDTTRPVAEHGFSTVVDQIHQRRPLSVPALPGGTRKITFTSGTTGHPKGVCLDGEAQLTVAHSLMQLSRDGGVQRHLCVLPLATLLENIAGVYTPLLAGACIELPHLAAVGMQGASGLDLGRFMATLHASGAHSLILLPQMLMALVTAMEHGAAAPRSLRFIAVGGGRVAPQLLVRADALGLPVFEGYGLSECASVVCLNTPEHRRVGTVGTALAHVQLALADDGEVRVRGARMLGYLGEQPTADDWLDTGDLGHFEGEFLVLHGRKKHQFITAYGRNVNPEWVEAELVQQGAIAQAWLHGEALAENLAVLVPRNTACSDADLQAAVNTVNATLPDYARVHRWLRAAQAFSVRNGLVTANGRLRRDALLAQYHAAFTTALNPQTEDLTT